MKLYQALVYLSCQYLDLDQSRQDLQKMYLFSIPMFHKCIYLAGVFLSALLNFTERVIFDP